MNKSLLQQTDNKQSVATPHDVGRIVQVSGAGKGILRYVGMIHGKEGLFCGVELIGSPGKHDGTYGGVRYFECQPGRGIFAPLYKVALDDAGAKLTTVLPQNSTKMSENRLSRSALPALPLRTSQPRDPSIDSSVSGDDPMTMSFISDINMDGSTFSTGSWSDVDASMINSRYTYTVRKGFAILQDEESDLMAVPALQSIVDVEQRSDSEHSTDGEEPMGSSFVVEKPKMGIERLPIVDDEKTPIVETKPLPASSKSPQLHDSATKVDPNHNKVMTNGADKNAGGPAVRDRQGNGNTSSEHLQKDAQTKAFAGAESKKTIIKGSEMIQPEKLKQEGGKEETPRTKKMKEVAPAPVVKFPVKPKAPSKHQLMMEQLKASIEAEKGKPKKEIKSKVAVVSPPTTGSGTVVGQRTGTAQTGQQQENEHAGMKEIKQSTTKEEKKPKQPLKTVNEPAPVPVVERPKKERKPLYEPPPVKERKELPKSKLASSRASIVSNKDETHGVTENAPSKATSEKKATVPSKASKPASFPTSSFAGAKRSSAISAPGSSVPSTTAAKTKSAALSGTVSLKRLYRATSQRNAFMVVMAQRENHVQELNVHIEKKQAELEKKIKELDELRKRLTESDNQQKEEAERMRLHCDQVSKSHSDELKRAKKQYESQLAEKAKENERNLEDERSRHQAEMEAMNRRHQTVVADLDEKIAEIEKVAEQLKADKKALQTALANDSDQRNQMLSKEINSLQTALELKSSEMKELRQKYQQIALRVEEIPMKELEISKLRHKVNELKQALEQKLSHEKILVHQNEELKRQQMQILEEKDSMMRSMDVMMYKYENASAETSTDNMGNGGSGCGEERGTETPPETARSAGAGRVQMRTGGGSSRTSTPQHRPVSGLQQTIPPEARLSNSSHSDYERDSLSRSTISMFASQIKLPEGHSDDVIYAPDEVLTSRDSRILTDEQLATTANGNCDSHSDSGITV